MNIRFLFIFICLLFLVSCVDNAGRARQFVQVDRVRDVSSAPDARSLARVQSGLAGSVSLFSIPSNNVESFTVRKSVRDTERLKFDKVVSGFSVSGKVNFLTVDDSLVRVLLVDKQGIKHLVFETYSRLEPSNTVYVSNFCEETCALPVDVDHIEFHVVNADFFVDSFEYAVESLRSGVSRRQQVSSIVSKLNTNLKKKGFLWTADVTPVSLYTYQQKENMFPYPENVQPRLPNLKGFEHYRKGIFEMNKQSTKNRVTGAQAVNPSLLPAEFDWRDRHGQNWLTSVKNQGQFGNCWAFALNGALESHFKLWYNGQFNLDLSEQQIVDCVNSADTLYGMNPGLWQGVCINWNPHMFCNPGHHVCVASQHGLVDESCYPYDSRDLGTPNISSFCSSQNYCMNFQQRLWKNQNNFYDYVFSSSHLNPSCPRCLLITEPDLKIALIKFGPLVATYYPWNHAMLLAGYYEARLADPVWIFKNSWGTGFGMNGYVDIAAPVTELEAESILGSFTPPTNTLYWPSGFTNQINCIDNDGDGYYSWGINDTKPTSCPPAALPEEDCDDSNPNLGPYDANYNCVVLSGTPPSTCTPWTSKCVYGTTAGTITSIYQICDGSGNWRSVLNCSAFNLRSWCDGNHCQAGLSYAACSPDGLRMCMTLNQGIFAGQDSVMACVSNGWEVFEVCNPGKVCDPASYNCI